VSKSKVAVKGRSGPKRAVSGISGDVAVLAATVGIVGVGAAAIEAALIPAVVIGAAAALAPRWAPRLRRRLKPLLALPASKPAAPAPRGATPASFAPGQALAKTITYRVFVTGLDFSWNYAVIGEAAAAAGLSTLSLVVSPIFYFLHETAWNKFGTAAMRKMGLWRGSVEGQKLASASPAPRGRFTIDRALMKTVTFRVFATVSEFTTNYVFVRDVPTALALSAFGVIAGPFLYLGHEKAWEYYGSRQTRVRLPAPLAQAK